MSTSSSYSFTVTGNRSLVARFNTAPVIYTITTSSNPRACGTTSGGGQRAANSIVTVIATANSGYVFYRWEENRQQVSTSASYSFTVTGNRNLVARFNTAPVMYTITTSSNTRACGTTSGGGQRAANSIVTVIAIANSGYVFSRWEENGQQVSTSASYSFTVTGNRSLVARFNTAPMMYTITTSSNPRADGTTSGGGVHQQTVQRPLQ